MRMTDEELRMPTDLPFDQCPPYRIKMVEYAKPTTRQLRKELIEKYGWNPTHIPAEYIFINLITDSGTGCMSDRQWSAMMLGDESYFNCKSWFNYDAAVKEVTNLPYVIPCHQGRSGENILYELLCKEGNIIPSNTHFTTTRAMAYANDAFPTDLMCPEYENSPARTDVFKGGIDIEAFEKLVKEKADQIPFMEMVMPNNLNGGQPVSMENLRAVRKICDNYDILLFIDCARLAENCYQVKLMEDGYSDKTCLEIAKEVGDMADVMHMSSKKCALVNIGGFVAVRDEKIYKLLQPKVIRTDGFITYGGLAGRDLEAVAVGLLEGFNDYYLQNRQAQVEHFANELRKNDVAIYEPPMCYAVFVDAGKCLPHLEWHEGPASSLATQAYIEAGVAITPFGSLHRAREDKDDPTNEAKLGRAPFELIRCAMPRRVYTEAHYSVVAKAIGDAMKRGIKVPAYRRIKMARPPIEHKDIGLRPFFDEFEPVKLHE